MRECLVPDRISEDVETLPKQPFYVLVNLYVDLELGDQRIPRSKEGRSLRSSRIKSSHALPS